MNRFYGNVVIILSPSGSSSSSLPLSWWRFLSLFDLLDDDNYEYDQRSPADPKEVSRSPTATRQQQATKHPNTMLVVLDQSVPWYCHIGLVGLTTASSSWSNIWAERWTILVMNYRLNLYALYALLCWSIISFFRRKQFTNGDYHLWCLMGVQENSILCHGVLDKELLEIPESKICDFRHFFFRSHKNIAGLEVAMHHGTPHVVKACDSLTIQ